MKNLPVGTLGGLERSQNGLYPHINDRCIDGKIAKAINDKISMGRRAKLMTGAPVYDIVGYLTGYETIYNATGSAGYCDWNNRQIAVSMRGNGVLLTACHEISHAIQADLGLFNDYGRLMSWQIKMERQCETMAYYLYNGIFQSQPAHWSRFDAYTTKESVLWLAEWYKGYVENDLIYML